MRYHPEADMNFGQDDREGFTDENESLAMHGLSDEALLEAIELSDLDNDFLEPPELLEKVPHYSKRKTKKQRIK
jgi:hypothetical protein